MPASTKVSAENLFIKDKYVSEELRNLAMELNTVFVTAAQLNRGAVEEIEFEDDYQTIMKTAMFITVDGFVIDEEETEVNLSDLDIVELGFILDELEENKFEIF